jgi:hypothetical protein
MNLKNTTMKNHFIILLALTTLISCKNDNDLTPLEQLPPATQTGENTVGCLLNGEAFLPDRAPNSTNCYYQLYEGGYYFHFSFSNRNKEFELIALGINTTNLQIFEGQSYSLIEEEDGNASGVFFYRFSSTRTSQDESGELTITKLDFENNIVSGTFWYDIIDNQGMSHKVREGRFDMRFTQ